MQTQSKNLKQPGMNPEQLNSYQQHDIKQDSP